MGPQQVETFDAVPRLGQAHRPGRQFPDQTLPVQSQSGQERRQTWPRSGTSRLNPAARLASASSWAWSWPPLPEKEPARPSRAGQEPARMAATVRVGVTASQGLSVPWPSISTRLPGSPWQTTVFRARGAGAFDIPFAFAPPNRPTPAEAAATAACGPCKGFKEL